MPRDGEDFTIEEMEDDPVAAVVAEFNQRYLVVNECGKAVIFQPGYDPVFKRRWFDRLTPRDLQTLYMNRQIKVGEDDKGRPQFKSAADVWLRHPRRHQYIHGVTFDPASTSPQPGILNLWEGFAVAPTPGDWSLLRAHIHEVICCGDALSSGYLTGWMALMIQKPAEQGEVAVVMRGDEGVGKGTVAKVLMRLTGRHGLQISNPKHLVGNFNAHLRDVIFLCADEAFFAGDRAHVGVLKSLITESDLTIEAKFANAVRAPNFLHIMMASNNDWVVPASIESRRFFVLDVPDTRKNDHTYFAAIWKQMEAGGYEAMLHDLLNMDLSAFNFRAVPTTAGLQHQRKLSLPTTEAWWLDCLERGYVLKSKLGLETDFAKWYPKISTELLFASYLEYAQRAGERRPLSRETLGRFFVRLKAVAIRWRCGVTGEAIANETTAFGGVSRVAKLVRQDRTTGYKFGMLDAARADFCAATGLKVQWDDGVATDAPEGAEEV